MRLRSRFALVCALALSLPALSFAQEAELRAARQLLTAGRMEEAIEAFRGVLEQHPDHPQATHLLGYALHASGRLEEALAVHLRGTGLPGVAGPSAYNVACVHALLGRPDEAFAWLEKAIGLGFADRELARTDGDLASLHDDARWERFLGSFERRPPFAPEVRLHYAIDGEAAGDQFGWIARVVGDVDGDGVRDFTTSAPTKARGGAGAGTVYLYSGRAGTLLWKRDGEPAQQLGMGLEAAGDVDGDGVGDVIAGAPGAGPAAGRAYVFSGRDGSTLLELGAGEGGDSFGRSVAGVGDLDGDGRSELLVGAPRASGGGRAYLYGANGELRARFEAEGPADRFGSCVAGGNGLLLIGAPDAGAEQGGLVYVFRGTGGQVTRAFEIRGDEKSRELGAMFLSVVGDTSGDGTPDVYASDWSHAGRGDSTGQIRVHSGSDGAELLVLGGAAAGEGFGIGPARLGDVDHDGCDDLVIGAWQSAVGAPSGGRVAVHSGKDGKALFQVPCAVAQETFGFDAEGLGDIDGDGVLDLLVTGAWSAVPGPKGGRVFVLSSAPHRAAR